MQNTQHWLRLLSFAHQMLSLNYRFSYVCLSFIRLFHSVACSFHEKVHFSFENDQIYTMFQVHIQCIFDIKSCAYVCVCVFVHLESLANGFWCRWQFKWFVVFEKENIFCFASYFIATRFHFLLVMHTLFFLQHHTYAYIREFLFFNILFRELFSLVVCTWEMVQLSLLSS